MIDSRDVLDRLADAEREWIETLDCFDEVDSTSTWLINEAPPAPRRSRIAIADAQTAGRGRRDNRWASPRGAGLWLSLSYTFETMPAQLPALTLAIGAALADALRELGADIRLKWPNDLIANDAKLGGILVERQSRGSRDRTVVVGVGINVDLPADLTGQIEKERGARVTDLTACLDEPPSRTELAAIVVRALIASIRRFADSGLTADLAAWQRYDWLAGKRVTIVQDGGRITGTAKGIDADGALLVRANGCVQRIVSGSVDLQGPAEAFR